MENRIYKYNSYGKINLVLEVLGKREDGFHEIRSLMHKIELHDEMEFTVIDNGKKEVTMECDKEGIPLDDKNIAVKCAKLFLEKYNINKSIHILLKKNIPEGGGLGGGSANGATTLEALNEIFNLKVPDSELQLLGSEVGSDVPFFISNVFNSVYGRGEIVKKVKKNIKKHDILLLFPNYPLYTSKVYGKFKMEKDIGQRLNFVNDFIDNIDNITTKNIGEYLYNDLESCALQVEPKLSKELEKLKAFSKNVLLSGSGSTIFVVDEMKVLRRISQETNCKTLITKLK